MESRLTQEQLGEKIGVTNKIISRWENGNYLPPIECLTLLSDLYGVSINEIVSGERLTRDQYREEAEHNLKDALITLEKTYKSNQTILYMTLAATTIIAIAIISLLPLTLMSIWIVVLVCALAFICNTVIIVALELNKERYMSKKES